MEQTQVIPKELPVWRPLVTTAFRVDVVLLSFMLTCVQLGATCLIADTWGIYRPYEHKNPGTNLNGLVPGKFRATVVPRTFFTSVYPGFDLDFPGNPEVATRVGPVPYWCVGFDMQESDPRGWSIAETAFGLPFRQFVLSEGIKMGKIVRAAGTKPETVFYKLEPTSSWRRWTWKVPFNPETLGAGANVQGIIWLGLLGNAAICYALVMLIFWCRHRLRSAFRRRAQKFQDLA